MRRSHRSVGADFEEAPSRSEALGQGVLAGLTMSRGFRRQLEPHRLEDRKIVTANGLSIGDGGQLAAEPGPRCGVAVGWVDMIEPDDLPVVEFADVAQLRAWLEINHASSPGVWIRVGKRRSSRPSVTFEDVLAEGLCFGWSESKRRSLDLDSYLQRFTPRRRMGTASERNRRLIASLTAQGRMTPAGQHAMGD